MSRWPLVFSFCALVVAGVSDAAGQSIAGETTIAEWYRFSADNRAMWVGGAMATLTLLGVACEVPPTIGAVTDAIAHRYLSGAFKGTDRALSGLLVVIGDHGCIVQSEEAFRIFRALMRAIRRPSR